MRTFDYILAHRTFTIVLLGLVISILASSCFSEKKSERIVCGLRVENCRYNIGKVNSANNPSIYKFSYVLENTSNQKVLLDSVEISCNCLTILHSPQQIEAYCSDSIVGFVDVTNLNGDFSRSIYVNFSKGDVMLLRVAGTVQ